MTDEDKEFIRVKEAITNNLTVNTELTLPATVQVSKASVSNGTQTITIDAKGPTAVGTATITKWLSVVDSGTTYFIPMWT